MWRTVYLPTWMVDLYGINSLVNMQSSHGFYGIWIIMKSIETSNPTKSWLTLRQMMCVWGVFFITSETQGNLGSITVDGWNPANQLRLVVYPIIYRVLAPSKRWSCRISSINGTILRFGGWIPRERIHLNVQQLGTFAVCGGYRGGRSLWSLRCLETQNPSHIITQRYLLYIYRYMVYLMQWECKTHANIYIYIYT